MHDPRPKETKGVPWGDHNETASGAPETRREEYGDADPSQDADERAADHSTERDDRSPSDTGTESNDEESSGGGTVRTKIRTSEGLRADRWVLERVWPSVILKLRHPVLSSQASSGPINQEVLPHAPLPGLRGPRREPRSVLRVSRAR